MKTKRVHWDNAVDDNISSKSKSTPSIYKTKIVNLAIIEQVKHLLQQYFINATFSELNTILDNYTQFAKINILTVDNYYPFIAAAKSSNLEAMKFIINALPKKIAYNMVHYSEPSKFMPFKLYLLNQIAKQKFSEYDKQKYVEGVKIFLKIDFENFKNYYDEFIEAYLSTNNIKQDSIEFSVRSSIKKNFIEDFNIAQNQLQEEGIISTNENEVSALEKTNDQSSNGTISNESHNANQSNSTHHTESDNALHHNAFNNQNQPDEKIIYDVIRLNGKGLQNDIDNKNIDNPLQDSQDSNLTSYLMGNIFGWLNDLSEWLKEYIYLCAPIKALIKAIHNQHSPLEYNSLALPKVDILINKKALYKSGITNFQPKENAKPYLSIDEIENPYVGSTPIIIDKKIFDKLISIMPKAFHVAAYETILLNPTLSLPSNQQPFIETIDNDIYKKVNFIESFDDATNSNDYAVVNDI